MGTANCFEQSMKEPHRDDGKGFVVRADQKLAAFGTRSGISGRAFWIVKLAMLSHPPGAQKDLNPGQD